MSTDSQDGVSGPTPLKAKGKMKTRKASTENLFDGNGEKSGGPMRASSMEDIHSLSSQGSGNKTGNVGAKIVDAVVKLYLPDHSHKYIDISPVSTGWPQALECLGVVHQLCGIRKFNPCWVKIIN